MFLTVTVTGSWLLTTVVPGKRTVDTRYSPGCV